MDKYLIIKGDQHGNVDQYVEAVKDYKYSLQIGDMGFNYDPLRELDPNHHKFLGGNHDNYDWYYHTPHNLGDFGKRKLGGFEFFCIRGAYSIDYKGRLKHERKTGRKSWWKEEELALKQSYKAYEEYVNTEPNTVVTHDCPTEVAKIIGKPEVLRGFGFNPDTFDTSTQMLLQQCFNEWQPSLWIFGHFHTNRVVQVGCTTFICLGERTALDVTNLGYFMFQKNMYRFGK